MGKVIFQDDLDGSRLVKVMLKAWLIKRDIEHGNGGHLQTDLEQHKMEVKHILDCMTSNMDKVTKLFVSHSESVAHLKQENEELRRKLRDLEETVRCLSQDNEVLIAENDVVPQLESSNAELKTLVFALQEKLVKIISDRDHWKTMYQKKYY